MLNEYGVTCGHSLQCMGDRVTAIYKEEDQLQYSAYLHREGKTVMAINTPRCSPTVETFLISSKKDTALIVEKKNYRIALTSQHFHPQKQTQTTNHSHGVARGFTIVKSPSIQIRTAAKTLKHLPFRSMFIHMDAD